MVERRRCCHGHHPNRGAFVQSKNPIPVQDPRTPDIQQNKEKPCTQANSADEDALRTAGKPGKVESAASPTSRKSFASTAKARMSNGEIGLSVEGHAIAEVIQARILCLWARSNDKASRTINSMKITVKQFSKMMHRITHYKKGIREKDILRLVQALVLSRITYGLPHHSLNMDEETRLTS
ncbi:hypothetical protein HPB49_010783 [Dermacentor silvarum]|uniref:Uncharacterized protein n=1 Tax=Dermacentor silvarum TaxID=543639 RepID=A0ACB8CWR2_DERSI|nr:hypothetical protein HPB49_010783 [Dermacentor silvarum]